MKRIIFLITFLLIVGLNSCCDNNNKKQSSNTKQSSKKEVVYRGHRWDIVKISENIYVIAPGGNARRGDLPIVVDVNLPGGVETINKAMKNE